MSLEVTGTLIKFYDERTFPSGFCVREFVIRTEEQYPQEIVLQATGNAQRRDKIDTLNKFAPSLTRWNVSTLDVFIRAVSIFRFSRVIPPRARETISAARAFGDQSSP